MAVSARLNGVTFMDQLAIHQTWEFYDPADPANSTVSQSVRPTNILHVEVIAEAPENMTVQKVTDRLVRIAAQVVLGRNIVTSLNTNVPAGTIVPLA